MDNGKNGIPQGADKRDAVLMRDSKDPLDDAADTSRSNTWIAKSLVLMRDSKDPLDDAADTSRSNTWSAKSMDAAVSTVGVAPRQW